jgi:hypothetical protein
LTDLEATKVVEAIGSAGRGFSASESGIRSLLR